MVRLFLDNGSGERPELDLMADSFPELSRTNPFLTNEGSQSIPFTLPASKGNLEKLDFPQRPALSVRKNTKPKAILSDGTAWIQGTLYIESVNLQEGITCTFYTNEGRLYEKLKGYRLRDISWDTIGSESNTVDDLMNVFNDQINGVKEEDEKYLLCSAGTSKDFFISKDNPSQLNFYMLLNELEYDGNVPKLVGRKERVYYDDDTDSATEITIPKGYGVTPFMRLSYVLRKIFEEIGYTPVFENFNNDISFNRIVILNNIADSCVKGYVNPKDILPDISLEDFINAVRIKFGMEFIEVNGSVYWRSWQETCKKIPDFDIKSVNYPTLTYEDAQAINMELNYLTDEGKPSSVSTKHNNPSDIKAYDISFNDYTPVVSLFISQYAYNISGNMAPLWSVSPMVGDVAHINTTLYVDEEEEEDNNEMIGLTFCFAVKGVKQSSGQDYSYPYLEGSVSNYSGLNKWGNFDLLITGIYDNFYENRDEMLQKANQQIVVEARIPAHLINTMDVSTPKVLDDVKVLIERIDYVLGKEELCQVTARTLEPMS